MTSLDQALNRLDAFIAERVRTTPIPGLAIAVTDRVRTLHAATYGHADVAARVPVGPEHLFEIGSISKSFTAFLCLQQQAAGRLDLHAPLQEYLPWFDAPSEFGPTTIHQLLSHTAGITRGTDFAPSTRAEVWALREARVAYPPGERFHYSNVGYKALGFVLEELLGERYGDVLRRAILDPLGMDASAPELTFATRDRMAVGFTTFYDDRPQVLPYRLVPAVWHEYGGADGSVASNAADMTSYIRMLLNRGRAPGGRLLSEAGFDRLVAPVVDVGRAGVFGAQAFYGYGLGIEQHEGRTVISHGGGTLGYRAALLADLDDGLGMIVLTSGPNDPFDIAKAALFLCGAARRGGTLPLLDHEADPFKAQNAAQYAGLYGAGEDWLRIEAIDDRLFVTADGELIPLRQYEEDSFIADHPRLVLFPLRLRREGGQVVAVTHGPDWYPDAGYQGPREFSHPPEWAAYPGHYRSHNPWNSSFRVVLRQGQLVLIWGPGHEDVLVPAGDGAFALGAESPERVRFGSIASGQALVADLSGARLYRAFTAGSVAAY